MRDALARVAKKSTPDPLPHGPALWTADNFRAALDAFRGAQGRRPTKTELSERADLPQYTPVRRALGPRPLTTYRN